MIWAIAAALAGPVTDVDLARQALADAAWRRVPVPDLLGATDRTEEAVELARVQALGRLRDPAALAPLLERKGHGSEAVRAEVAFALGLTPGSASAVRRWLGETAVEPTLEGRLLAEHGVRWRLVEALGRVGEATDVPRLVAMLEEGWPYDDAAARALLRLHRREVDVRAARPPLIAALRTDDARTTESVAQTLVRVGLTGLPATQLDAVVEHARTAPSGMARGSLVKALVLGLPDDSPHRETLQTWAAWDVPLVRALAIEADTTWRLARPGSAVVVLSPGPPGLDELLTHEDPWLRLAAIDTLGWRARTPSIDDWMARTTPSDRARAIRAMGLRDDAAAKDVDRSWIERAAWLAGSDDIELLVTTAIGAKDGWADNLDLPGLRSAAVERLMALEVGRDVAVRLLVSPDPAIREAAMGMLEGPPDRALVEELVLALRVESDGEVLRAGLDRLAEMHTKDRRAVSAERFLVSTLKRALAHRSPGLRASADRLARRLGLDLPVPPPERQERELILPDGTVTTTKGDLPQILEASRYDRAVVTTTAGQFTVTLDPATAPLAVHELVQLARKGFYQQSRWHRIVPGFVAQGGCPRGDGWGGPGWTVVDEVGDVPFTVGAVGMARGDRDTAGSQWFVMTGPARFLDGDYTRFGEVTEGMEVVRMLSPDDRISAIRLHVRDDSGG